MKYFIKITIICTALSLIHADMIRPTEGERVNYLHIPFEWEQEANAVDYNLQVSNRSDFNTLLIDENISKTLYLLTNGINWDSTYFWRVRPIFELDNGNITNGDWIDSKYFITGEPAYDQPINVEIADESQLQDGFVAIGGFAPELQSVILDKYGNEIWNDDGFQFMLNHINEHGNIYGFSSNSYPFNTGMKTNSDIDVVWSTMDGENPVDSHEIKQIPNGNYMAFINVGGLGPIPDDNYMTEFFRSVGYQADGTTLEFPYYGQMIVEWNEDHEIVWLWNPFDHFTTLDNDNYEGTWYNAYFNQTLDWLHSNAFHFDENESAIYVSHRHISRISKIAYPSGEVIWNMGLPSEYIHSGDDHICSDLLFSFQHHVQLMDNGDLLFFDNGNLSEMLLGDENPTTRLRRVRVIEDSYCETVWEYEFPPNLFGQGMGSVLEQENGNYLVYTFGNGIGPECSVLEIIPNESFGGQVVWKATASNPNAAWYRAYKIPTVHPDLFNVIANDYNEFEEIDAISVSPTSPEVTFTIHNESGYFQDYFYTFQDEGNGWFENSNAIITIDPYSSAELSFSSEFIFGEQSSISLMVNPIHHSYRTKNYNFEVLSIPDLILGDVNYDESLNVLDVVLLVGMILGSQTPDYNTGDINLDNDVNVLDVVLLVNLILDI